jgi:hypothetical protein
VKPFTVPLKYALRTRLRDYAWTVGINNIRTDIIDIIFIFIFFFGVNLDTNTDYLGYKYKYIYIEYGMRWMNNVGHKYFLGYGVKAITTYISQLL